MKLPALKAMRDQVLDLVHPDGAWLFMWITSPHMPQALELGKAWGFKYSARAFVWIKTHRRNVEGQAAMFIHPGSMHIGTGYTTRKNAEDVLLFRRGQPKREARDVRELIFAPPREHSRKPDETFERIERYCAGPRVELFAREERPGWDAWGNETTRFNEAAE